MEIGPKIKNVEIACSYMERVFFSLFHPQKPMSMPRENKWHPFTNVYETEEEICVEIELAGVRETDVRINFQNNFLIIQGMRKDHLSEKKILYHQMEVEYGPFERVIYFPFSIDKEKVEGIYEEGFLTITLPKCSQKC